MKKESRIVLTLITAILVLIGSFMSYADSDVADNGKWAFYFYTIDNDNNAAFNEKVLQEMYSVDLSDKIILRSESSRNNPLYEFLKDCEKDVVADHKVLIVIGDSDGAYGFVDADKNYVGISDIKDSLSLVYEKNENKPAFDLALFDASFAASAEMGHILNGYVRYFVAPETSMYVGYGFYKKWFSDFVSNTSITALDLGKNIIDAFKTIEDKNISRNNNILSVNLTLFDVKKLEETFKAYTVLIKNIIKRMNSDNLMLSHVSYIAREALLTGNYKDDSFSYNMIDLMDFMRKLKKFYPMECGKVMNALEQATLYKVNLGFSVNLYGAGIYFPRKSFGGHDELLQQYLYAINNEYVSAFYNYKINGQINDEFASIINKEKYNKIKPIDFSICKTFTDVIPDVKGKINFTHKLPAELKELFQYAYVNLFKRTETEVTSYNIDNYCVQDGNNNIKVTFDGTWATIDDNPLNIIPLDETREYETFYANVRVNDQMKKLLFAYDEKDGIQKILGTSVENEGMNDLKYLIAPLQKGDDMILYESVYDMYTGLIKSIPTDTFAYNGNYKIENQMLPEGDYTYQIVYEDLQGRKHEGQNVFFSVSGNSIEGVILEKELYEMFD